jgi:LAO/AO transport system ATPase
VLEPLLARFRSGDRLALSRLLSHVAHGQHIDAISESLRSSGHTSFVVAITGSAGVGKSTLVGKLIEHIRMENQTVAVLACDPQSPVSGGALLGDRFRMPTRPDDDGIFIRSLAAEGGHGAVALHVEIMLNVLEAFGFDVILLETVGAGQGDTTVRDLADVVVLLLQPETGDDLQWEKAGVLEIADVVVVHKGDMPGADHVEAQVNAALQLSGGAATPVIRVSSKTGAGIPALWAATNRLPRTRNQSRRSKRAFTRIVEARFAEQLGNAKDRDPVYSIYLRWEKREITDDEATRAVISVLAN